MQPSGDGSYPRQRNPRACEACRISKSRCFASDELNICQRCLKSRLSCIVRATARPRRAKRANLPPTGGVSNHNPHPEVEDPAAIYIKLQSIPPLDSRDSVAIIHSHHQEIFKKLLPTEQNDGYTVTPATSIQTPQSNGIDDKSSVQAPRRNITIDQAEKLLQIFHGIKHFYPYIIVAEDATVKLLSRRSPFLLLAILCAASATDIQLNYQLDHEFKRVMSKEIIIEGRKSLDFLQGLLVYIAWYPCHLKPRNRQAFMYINLALSLADDLGMGHRYQVTGGLCPDSIETEGLMASDGFSNAAKRAYMGSYYLSSAIAMGFQKPNGLKYNDTMEEFGISLARDGEMWSDKSLLPLIKSHSIQERIRDTLFSTPSEASAFNESPFQAEMNVETFNNEAEEWKRTLPQDLKTMPHMIIAERFLTVNIFSHDLAFFRPILNQQDRYLNPVTLSRCLEASKKFFESLLSIPAAQYHGFTNIEWSRIIQSIIILSRLSFPLPRCPGWDIVAAREHAPLGMFLDCLCYRMQALSSTTPNEPNPKDPDGPFIFRLVLESIKKTYEQRVALVTPKPSNSEQTAAQYLGFQTPAASPMDKLHCPMNDCNLRTYFEPLVAEPSEMSFMTNDVATPNLSTQIPLYHDLWATMTMSWSDD